jgi:ABC-type nitrate/sulfonate/bicarbonate transport system ATPase subunit
MLPGYRPLGRATGGMEARIHALHRSGENLVVAVTHDINVAAFLAGRGVILSFTDETWPDYLDSAVVIETRDGNREYGFIRWDKRFEVIDLIDVRYA